MAGATARGDVVFADSEHLGLPLLLFLWLRGRKPARTVILAHMPGKWWKRAMLRVFTRLRSPGTLLLHSVSQREIVATALPSSWSTRLIAYQADTRFWDTEPRADGSGEVSTPPTIVAVGSEHRDYETLLLAVADLPARVVIAAGSHWARSLAGVDAVPPNVEYTDEVLSFRQLRELYRSATAVVVPLHDVPNQSGITTILEAMSMGIPVITTASRGQREAIAGPLVLGDGTFDFDATADRGPHVLEDARPPAGLLTAPEESTGLYVPPCDAAALRHALQAVIEDPALAARLGGAGAASVRGAFALERFVDAIASELTARAPMPDEPRIEVAR